jgi:dipeptidyl aminopeptidase/acylaminoacyl peptidase
MPSRCLSPIVASLLLLGLCASASAQDRPYTVDDMLLTEGIGKVRFDPGGRYVLFERYAPFAEQPDFGRPHLPGQLRSNLYIMDLSQGGEPRPLFNQRRGRSYTLISVSPDGSHIAFLRASADGMAVGIYDVARRRERELDFPVGRAVMTDARWLSNSQLALPAASAGDLPDWFAIQSERVDQVVERWHKVRAGRDVTVSQLGSGRHAPTGAREGSLIVAQAGRSNVRPLAAGTFSHWFASPDGGTVAALKTSRLIVAGDREVDHAANIGGVQRELILYDPRGGGGPLALCPGCDVLPSSVNWSPSGRYLSFFARDSGRQWSDGSFRIHDRRTATTSAAPLAALSPHMIRRELDLNVGSAWLGETLVVRAQEGAAAGASSDPAVHWYLLGTSGPVNLTAAFGTTRAEVVATSGDRLVMLADREAWTVDASGRRINLTAEIAAPVGLWRVPHASSATRNDVQPTDILVLDSRADPAAPREMLFIHVPTGAVTGISAPSATSEILAVSPATRQVAFLDTAENVGILSVGGAQGRRVISQINRHLAGVVGGTPLRVDHQGPDGSSRISWLLLPPGYRPGQRLPTVVQVYPGSVNGPRWTRSQLGSTTPLNDHILAARGYAVLYPSLPGDQRLPRDPLEGLRESVFAAVDAAVAQGYVDPDRLALQGQSLGGYGVAGLIARTDRFKAAVAQAGFYDLFSIYGQIDPRRRLSVEQDGLNLFGVSISETGHLGMGGPPWRDPQRYLRNSPISHVESVTTPVMLIHGDLDYVPITQAEEYFSALVRLNKDAVFLRYFGEDHVFNSPANIRDMWQRIFAWYERYLGPAGASAAPGRAQ